MSERGGFITDAVDCPRCRLAVDDALRVCVAEGRRIESVVVPGPFRIAGFCGSPGSGCEWFDLDGMGALIDALGDGLCHPLAIAVMSEAGHITRVVAHPGGAFPDDVEHMPGERDFVVDARDVAPLKAVLVNALRAGLVPDARAHSWAANLARKMEGASNATLDGIESNATT